MDKFIKGYEVTFLFDIRTSCKIKFFDIHVTKPWVAYVTQNNVFALWDYQRKICVKTFTTSILDPNPDNAMISLSTKSNDLKNLKFLDKEMLHWLYSSSQPTSEKEHEILSSFNRNSIIFYNDQKIVFYDYVTDNSEIIGPTILENKTVKCISIMSHQYLIIGCGEGFIKIFDMIAWNIAKTLKGYHAKSINSIISFRQNSINRPKFIASSIDGLMGCWGVDLDSAPAFKFLMLKKGKPLLSANDGQKVISMTYDEFNYRLVTLSEEYLAVWSSISGMEIRRYKNNKNLKEIQMFSHSYFSKDSLLAHSKGSEIFLVDLEQENRVMQECSPVEKGKISNINPRIFIDLKMFQDIDKTITIYTIKIHQLKPHLIMLGTTHGFYIISLNKFSEPSCLFNQNYISYLSTHNAKEAVFDDGTLKKMTANQISKFLSYEATLIEDEDNRIPNFMYLTCFEKKIQCYLFELLSFYDKYEFNQNTIKSTIYNFDTVFPWDESELKCSFNGKYISAFNKIYGYFEIFAINNTSLTLNNINENNLLNLSKIEGLHLLSSLKKIYSGCAISLEWDISKDEFCALCPINKDGNFIKLEEKVEEVVKKISIFNSKILKNKSANVTQQIHKIIFCIFDINPEDYKIRLKHKILEFESPSKVFGGPIYGVVDSFVEKQLIDYQDILDEASFKEIKALKMNKTCFYGLNKEKNEYFRINKIIIEPVFIFWNIYGTICIATYQNFFHVYKMTRNNDLKFHKQIRETIMSGYFWENLFFFSTETEIFFLVCDLQNDVILLKLATIELDCNLPLDLHEYEDENIELFDSIYPKLQKRSPGHLKFLLIFDCKLMTINHFSEMGAICLDHPFIRFCMHLQFEEIDKCLEILSKFDENLHYIFADLFFTSGFQEYLQSFKGFSEIDKILLNIESGISDNVTEIINMETIKKMFLTYSANDEAKIKKLKEGIKFLAIKLHEKHKNEDLNRLCEGLKSLDRNDFLDDIFWLFPDKNLCVENSLKKRETFLIPKIIEKQQVEEYSLEENLIDQWREKVSDLFSQL